MHFFKLSIILLFSLIFQVEALANTQHRLALVVGNGDYQKIPLKNPVNDAKDFASALKKLGFEVILKTNTSIQEFDTVIEQFGRRLEETKGVGLFFYAGHGVQSKGKNYLIPVGSHLNRETSLKYKAIDAQKIIDEMDYAKNGLNIVILDACRNNPLTRSFRGSSIGLAKFDNTPSGLLIAYSTAPGKQAADGVGRNSPYTKQLLRSIQKDNLPLEMVFKDVMKNVKISTKGNQSPWMSSSVDGDFYFSKTSLAMLDNNSHSSYIEKPIKYYKNSNEPSQSEIELLFWQSIIDNPSQDKYKAYLEQYPDGHFSSIARSELKNRITNRRSYSRYNSTTPYRKSEPTITLVNIQEQFHRAIRDKDIFLAEGLLTQIKNKYPHSKKYYELEQDFKQLSLYEERVSLYANLIMEAFKDNNLPKAKHYLQKMESFSQRDSKYLTLKQQYRKKLEANKKVQFTLTSNINENTVFIDGIEYGSTPLEVLIKKGDYMIELKKHGYPTQRLKLALYASGTQHLQLTGGFATGLSLENPFLGIQMVAIEAGCVNMGSYSNEHDRDGDERRHKVCIKDAFWMGKYEITQKQWLEIMKKNPSHFDKCGSDCPVENIEYYEIQHFIKILNNRSQYKYRLPTEAEWEFTARAGTETPFHTGDCLTANEANINGKYQYNQCETSLKETKRKTVAVGSYPANAWNIHDMHGNVSEWTCSAYSSHYDGEEQHCYVSKQSFMPGSANTIERIVVRGGSWNYKPSYSRSSDREKEYPNANNKGMGFRLIREK